MLFGLGEDSDSLSKLIVTVRYLKGTGKVVKGTEFSVINNAGIIPVG